ncbi:MAG: FAD-binding protein [Chromatiales bacterium]
MEKRRRASRRYFLQTALATAGLSALGTLSPRALARAPIINDVTQLNPISVVDEVAPHSPDDVRAALVNWSGPLSVGGGRFSMGGQIGAPGTLHLDMRRLNEVVSFDPTRKVIRVQAGIRWRDIQDVIDPHDLSLKIMQTYSNFTVGGSVSVNCHGRYVGRGPLVNAVRALQLVTADGKRLELTRAENHDLFRAVFGGYGGLGVITEVEMDLEPNTRIERMVQSVTLADYPRFFREQVLGNPKTVLHNADLTPPGFDSPRAITWVTTERPLTEERRLIPRGLDYDLEQNTIWTMTELPMGDRLREKVVDPMILNKPAVVWRNHEASLDVASLEPRTRAVSTYALQEYFIPVSQFVPFARTLAGILKAHRVNALNVSVRHSPADTTSLLSWAPTEVFSFVLYYKQRSTRRATEAVGVWARALIEAALAHGGRYYLPYQLHATAAQFERAYPGAGSFLALKARVDPQNRFRNMLWDKYLAPVRKV